MKARIIDILFAPLTYLSCILLRYIRQFRLSRMPVSESIFMRTGVLPVHDHFYQPLINPSKHLSVPSNVPNELPGIDWNVNKQLEFLATFNYQQELLSFPVKPVAGSERTYFYNNRKFCSGDAEYYYSMIRTLKPARIIEIGSGFSTLMALNAVSANRKENGGYACEMTCVEPYQNFWLEELSVQLIRKPVQQLPLGFFSRLKQNDILFIDSSHIIRPQGDVLYEYLKILPSLSPGVHIHVHDIFSPFDYPEDWMYKEHRLWNEQYLLEAFLSCNRDFEVIGALNYLHQFQREALVDKLPVLRTQPDRQPGSFWIRKR